MNDVDENEVYIVAIDFDGTICRDGFPDITNGRVIQSTLDRMEALVSRCSKPISFILWTCRSGKRLQEAIDFCKRNNIPIEYANEQHPSVYKWLEGADDMKKIFAHEYWDDRAVSIVDYEAW